MGKYGGEKSFVTLAKIIEVNNEEEFPCTMSCETSNTDET